jgi:hypothetical protein
LSDAEAVALELDENRERKDLTAHERSKRRTEEIRAARREAKAEAAKAKTCGESPHVSGKGGRGKKGRKPGSVRDVAERTGYSGKDQQEAERHVEFADRYPFLQGATFKREHVLEIERSLRNLPAPEHAAAMNLAEREPWEPPQVARGICRLVDMEPTRRQRVYALAKTDPEAATALVFANAVPADPGLHEFSNGLARLRQARKLGLHEPACRSLDELLPDLRQLEKTWTEADKARREAALEGSIA